MITKHRDEMLRMTLHMGSGSGYLLILPADEGYLNGLKAYLGLDDFSKAEIRDVRFKVE